jgi:hypothetical protein
VADAAGHQWEIRPYRGGRPRLLRWPRRRWHYSEGRITGPA